jgi:hypothetical protein
VRLDHLLSKESSSKEHLSRSFGHHDRTVEKDSQLVHWLLGSEMPASDGALGLSFVDRLVSSFSVPF